MRSKRFRPCWTDWVPEMTDVTTGSVPSFATVPLHRDGEVSQAPTAADAAALVADAAAAHGYAAEH